MKKIFTLVIGILLIAGVAFAAQQYPVSTDTLNEAFAKLDNNDDDFYNFYGSSTTWQAYDADLTTYAGITPSANVQSLLGAATYAAMLELLDLEPGTDFYSTGATDTLLDAKEDSLGNPGTNGYVLASQTDGTRSWIASGALSDDSLLEVKLDATNSPTDNYILSYDSASGGFSWVVDATGAGGDQLGDIVATVPLLVNGTTNVDDVLPGSDGDLTFSMPAATSSLPGYMTVSQVNALEAIDTEAELEALLELADLQGAVTDAQVPNDITITGLSGTNTGDNTVATSGDSATSFFSTGTIEDERLSSNIPKLDEDNTFTGANTFGPFTDFVLEGATADDYEISASVTDPTADRTLYFGNFDMRIPASSFVNSSGGISDLAIASQVAGDILYFDGTNWIRLAKGTASQVLKMNAGETAPEWGASASGYTNLTSFEDQTAWRVFYSDGDGDVVELALGASGTVLKSNGASAAPSFQSDSTGDDASIETDAYGSGWNGDDTNGASQNVIYDYLHQFDSDDDGDFTDESWMIKSVSTVLAEPDQLQPISDAWLVHYFPAETYPSGVTIDAIHITTSATCVDVLNFEEWGQSATTATATVEAITLSGTFTEDDGTLADSSIAADGRLMVDLEASGDDIAFMEITVIFHAN